MKKIISFEVISYIIFGVLTTLVNWSVFAIFSQNSYININVANTIAWFVAVIFAFITNKLFVFDSKSFKFETIKKEGMLFLSARILSGVVEIGGFAFAILCGFDNELFGVKGLFAKFLISVFVIVVNYILSKKMIFRKSGESNDRESK